MEKYKQSLGSLYYYHRDRKQFFLSQNDRTSAGKELYKNSLLKRNNTSWCFELIRYADSLGRMKTLGHCAEMLRRDPYTFTNTFLDVHLKWGGSSIVALKAIQDAKKRGIRVDSFWEPKARGTLGDSFEMYKRYRNYSGLGTSLRYINWFESYRRQTLFSDSKQIRYNMDKEYPEVEIILPNGEVVVRRDHPITGQLHYFAIGGGFIQYDYDNEGNLTRIADSTGKEIRLHYDENSHISRMENKNDNNMTFKYNEKGKPVLISIEGVGSITVTYDNYGNIKRVKSKQGHKMALKVTQAFQKLLGMVKIANQFQNLDRLPEMKFTDNSYKELHQKLKDAEESEKIKAKMALGSYLATNFKKKKSYAPEAENIFVNDLFNSHAYQKERSSQKLALHGVLAYHKLKLESKPYGLPQNDFAQWSKMKTWLIDTNQQKHNWFSKLVHYKTHKSFSNALQSIEKQPIKQLKDTQWLHKADFKNTALWTRHGNPKIFGMEQPKMEKKAVLYRRNGDIIVGTEKGLFFHHNSHWTWLGFDDDNGRFSTNIPQNSLSQTSDILSLAESENGILWIGTARGLYSILPDGSQRRYRRKEEGLPALRVQSLYALHNWVLAGTPTGFGVFQSKDNISSKTFSRRKREGGVIGGMIGGQIGGVASNQSGSGALGSRRKAGKKNGKKEFIKTAFNNQDSKRPSFSAQYQS